MNDGFQRVLEHIRAISDSEATKGRRFERLMKAYFEKDPLYRDRFSRVWLWSEWAATRDDFDGADTGIDLVAEESAGGYCAIQCKCYAPGTRVSKPALDSFVSASAREPFTARIVVDTGDEWGTNAVKTLEGLKPACSVLRFGDLASRPFDWPDLVHQEPEDLSLRPQRFILRPHQRRALADVRKGFAAHDRGKLIMACGTGKTLTALRIAEAMVGLGGRVLHLVPSISLLQQSMREWAEQREMPHRYVGICSDTRAGHDDEDASLAELEIPVTTDPAAISKALRHNTGDAMTVVFCTYHSLGLVEQAQDASAPSFDLVLCDEAHRTTGVDRPGDETSPFVLVHDKQRIRADRRLYMTATPRLYTEGVKSKAAAHSAEVFSMDDEPTYGPEFHRLPFSKAIEQNLLSDYKVVVFTLSEEAIDAVLQAHLASHDSEINLTDAAKIVGCWRALQNPENKKPGDGPISPLTRAIAFTNTIASSRRLSDHWSDIVERAIERLPEADRPGAFRCETRHVDGKHNALMRKARIDWLKSDSGDTCHVLSNARCLSEGIDVPALDAVLFMSPKSSQVDIVQAVGRAMRKAEGKKYGYIILPVAVPAGADPATALNNNERFAAVWGVLRALRSHDDRFDAEINQIDLNRTRPDRIIFSTVEPGTVTGVDTLELPFPPLDLPPDAIYAKIVERCGDRKYWEIWAKDVADIFTRLSHRIGNLLDNPANGTLREWFDHFHEEVKGSINDSIGRTSAINMMAQHILTRPVFEALFEGYNFADNNPVARALDKVKENFREFGLENETLKLESFYRSVQCRARGLDNPEARQHVLMELYEKFFKTAMKKDVDRLGIVYTPVEIVDFILASADHALREELGYSLSDEGVHVLDPFAGTGIFLVRLLQSALVRDDDLQRKYREELHANEIVLLAYYIAAVHIEEAFHGRAGGEYVPFSRILLTDTFSLFKRHKSFPKRWLPDNSERAESQQKLPIEVIVGNPPWSAGQRSSADDNPNVDYPDLEKRIASTYVSHSKVTNKNSLYDTYKMAIRWASDRIGKQGVIAFVTNGSWIDGNADAGVRACLAEEFSVVYVLNLRGNARTSGKIRQSEGGNVFGQGSRAPVAIVILVKNPRASQVGCRIRYRDIGDQLNCADKLATLRDWESIAGIDDWKEIKPDVHNDWVSKRSTVFRTLYPLGLKEVKAGRGGDAIFKLFTNGYKTGRDTYVYNFSKDVCKKNAKKMVEEYCEALRKMHAPHDESKETGEVVYNRSSNLRWDSGLKNYAARRVAAKFSSEFVRVVSYRPFVKQHLYADVLFAQRPYRTQQVFPPNAPPPYGGNRAICVSGIGSPSPFSALITDALPDLSLVSACQCFPRYRYERPNKRQGELLEEQPDLIRIDNITDTALRVFRTHYNDSNITKDAIFDYVYGVLHAPVWRERFANDLAKELPRVPFAPDFRAFTEAGRALTELHLGYETCQEHSLRAVVKQGGEMRPEHCRMEKRAMRLAGGRTELIVNEHLRLVGIPPKAHEYQVNGRTPLEWLIDRYRVTQDKESGIVNDPNKWFDDPCDLIATIRRIVHVSVETAGIISGLPDPFPEGMDDGEDAGS